MKKLFLTSIAALSVLSASAAHTREWQGNMPKPVGKLPPYPPVVCVTPNWTPEPCEGRMSPKQTTQADDWDFLKPFFDWLKWTETNWLGTVMRGGGKLAKYDGHEWNGKWPHTTVLYFEPGGILHDAPQEGHKVIADPPAEGIPGIPLRVPTDEELRHLPSLPQPVKGSRYSELPYEYVIGRLRIRPDNWNKMIAESPRSSNVEIRQPEGLPDQMVWDGSLREDSVGRVQD